MTEYAENEYLFTSESVTEGHPDKVADQISDGVLDAVLAEDPYGRVACETLVNTGLVVVSGEISTTTYVDIQEIVRETIRKIGYTDADLGFSADSCAVINAIDKQSPDIAQGVDQAYETRTDPADEDELDIAGAARVEQELERIEREPPSTILLDLRALAFLDSTGLRVIVAADGRAREQARRLVIVRGTDTVQRIIEMTRLNERLEIVDDPAAAEAG